MPCEPSEGDVSMLLMETPGTVHWFRNVDITGDLDKWFWWSSEEKSLIGLDLRECKEKER